MDRCVVVLLVLLLPLAGAQPVVEDQPQGSDPWPTLSVPSPAAGDKIVYEASTLTYTDGTLQIVEPARIRDRLAVSAVGDVWDTWGEVRPAVSFSTHPTSAPWPMEWSTDLQTGKHLFYTYYKGEAIDSQGYGYAWSTATTLYRPQGGPQCGATHALQGHDGPAPYEIHLFQDACQRAYWGTYEGTGWRIDRVDGTGDGRTVAYRPTGMKGEGLVWFQDGNPYPVRFLDHDEQGTWTLLEMVAFERGPGAPPATLEPLPPVRYRTIERLDPGDMGTSWSLDAALAEAFDDRDVETFFEDHPEAYLRSSWFNEGTTRNDHELGNNETVLHGWYVVLDDGDEALKVDIERRTWREYIDTPLGPQPGRTDSWTTVETEDRGSQGLTWGEVPHILPTPDSARSRWEALTWDAARKQGANAFGHDLLCDPCDEPRGFMTAGRLAAESQYNRSLLGGYSGGSFTWTGSFLLLEDDGGLASHVENRVNMSFEQTAWTDVPALPVAVRTPIQQIIEDVVEGRSPGVPEVEGELHHPQDIQAPRPEPEAEAPVEVRSTTMPSPAQPWLYTGAAAGGALGMGLLWKFIGAALFSRVTQAQALKHPVRAHMMDLVREHPGIHLMELVRRTGKPQGTVRHHVEKLVETRLVEARRGPGGVAFFPPGTGATAKRQAMVLRSTSARRVHAFLQEYPHARTPQVAAATGLSARTARYHLRRLRDHGLI